MDLRPKSASGVLTDAMTYLSRTWKRLTLLGLLTFIPAGAITFLVFGSLGSNELLKLLLDPQSAQSLPPNAVRELASPYLQGTLIALGIQMLASLFVLAASHLVIASDIAGRSIGAGAAALGAVRRYPVLVATAVLTGIPVTIAFMLGFGVSSNPLLSLLFLVPGAWLLTSVSMIAPAVVIESRGVLQAVTRSFQLVRGRRTSTLGFLLIIGVLGLSATVLIQLAAIPMVAMGGHSGPLIATAVLGVAFQGLIVGAVGAPFTAWYLDLRARSEDLATENLS